MIYSLLWEIQPQTLDIRLESLKVGPGIANTIRPPLVFKLWKGGFSRLRLESQTPSRESRETEAQLTLETEAKADLEENIYFSLQDCLYISYTVYLKVSVVYIYMYIHATYKKYMLDTFCWLLLLNHNIMFWRIFCRWLLRHFLCLHLSSFLSHILTFSLILNGFNIGHEIAFSDRVERTRSKQRLKFKTPLLVKVDSPSVNP